jgi:polyhydroxybutyrate depolymerase
MSKKIISLVCGLLLLFIYPKMSYAESIGFKERIKQRWIKKQKEKSEPEVSDIQGIVENPGSYSFSLQVGNKKRFYILHVPRNYKKSNPAPLVIAMHGGGGNMKVQSQDKFYGLISKSDEEGTLLVFPNGYSKFESGALATWNAGECCGDARDNKSDDVNFIKVLIDKVSHQVSVKPGHVFAIGMSNGGMMAYRLACEVPELFKGIASVTGTDNTLVCDPKKAVSVLHIHARDDKHVLFEGGAGENAFRDRSKVTNFKSVPYTIEKWIGLNSCSRTSTQILKNQIAYCDLYKDCRDNAKVQLCVTEDGGHSWPGGGKSPTGKTKSSKAIIANDVIWDFFEISYKDNPAKID